MSSLYRPDAFAVSDDDGLDLIEAISVGHLVTVTAAGLFASFVPLLLDRSLRVLRGHLARANPHVAAIESSAAALVIFTGPDGYVSPSWYASKQRHGRVVPTWNYSVVHVHGVVRLIEGTGAVDSVVRDLTDLHESGRPDRWSVDDAPAEFIDALEASIVAVEVTIERLEAKEKFSQNRPPEDIAGVLEGLEHEPEPGRRLLDAVTGANPGIRPSRR
jgi:transcriptional regulator